MKILLLTQWFQPEPTFKGLPFAQALAARGHTVEVLTGFPNYPGGKLYPGYRLRLWQREVMEGIRVNRVALYPSHDRSGLRRMVNYLSFALSCLLIGPWVVSRPDVIYVYNLVTLGPAAFLLRQLFHAKVIMDVQDLWPESVTSSGMLRGGWWLPALMVTCSWIYRRADWLTVLSPGFKQTLIARGVSASKIEVIYNWCDETTQKPAPYDEALAEELGFKDHFNVLFAGTMGIMQGLDTVLEAAQICSAAMPSVQFVLMGQGIERARLEARAVAMGLNNVQFLPGQPPEAMGRFYALADALLVHLKDDPLFRITIPSKTQAYLYMGKPIIMAVRGDAAALVQRADAGLLCPPQDPVALAETVVKLATMPVAERERLGEAGKQFYYENLSMQVGIERFEQRMQILAGLSANS